MIGWLVVGWCCRRWYRCGRCAFLGHLVRFIGCPLCRFAQCNITWLQWLQHQHISHSINVKYTTNSSCGMLVKLNVSLSGITFFTYHYQTTLSDLPSHILWLNTYSMLFLTGWDSGCLQTTIISLWPCFYLQSLCTGSGTWRLNHINSQWAQERRNIQYDSLKHHRHFLTTHTCLCRSSLWHNFHVLRTSSLRPARGGRVMTMTKK